MPNSKSLKLEKVSFWLFVLGQLGVLWSTVPLGFQQGKGACPSGQVRHKSVFFLDFFFFEKLSKRLLFYDLRNFQESLFLIWTFTAYFFLKHKVFECIFKKSLLHEDTQKPKIPLLSILGKAPKIIRWTCF